MAKKIITLLLCLTTIFSVTFAGCSGGSNNDNSEPVDTATEWVEGKDYSNNIGTYDVEQMTETQSNYDTSLFYRNERNPLLGCPDPHVVYVSDETSEYYDTYFLYGTTGSGSGNFTCFTSKDLVSWVSKGTAYAAEADQSWPERDHWAPEVIYDAQADRTKYDLPETDDGTGVYFMFCSATSKDAYNYYTGKARFLQLGVATSPAGPFKSWSGVEKGAKIGGVDYGTEAGFATYCDYTDSENRGRVGGMVDSDDPWWNNSAARASLTFQYNNRDKAGNWVTPDGVICDESAENVTYISEGAEYMLVDEGESVFSGIDPTPFVDPITGQKYLFFTRETGTIGSILVGTNIYAFKMVDNDWAQIDYSSLTRISRTMYNFISDAAASAYNQDASEFDVNSFTKGVKETKTYTLETSSVEKRIMGNSNRINEGTQMQYNPESGLYYLTFSMGGYTNDTYTVIQVIAYNVLGPYRKLDVGEGGMLLSTDSGSAMNNVSGPGHHTMLSVYDAPSGQTVEDGELVIIYHKHIYKPVNNFEEVGTSAAGAARCPAIDRVEWVVNNNGMLVMHANGPTTFIQPKYYSTGETPYDNIAGDAVITATGNYSNLSALNDNVISVHTLESDGRDAVEPYVKEFSSSENQFKITLTFAQYRKVRALMIYNSRDYANSFKSDYYIVNNQSTLLHDIERIEMDVKINGVENTVAIKGLEFYNDFNKFAFGVSYSLRPGGAAVASFAETDVKEIRISFKNWDQGKLNISEIYVLGIPV